MLLAGIVIGFVVGLVVGCCLTAWMDDYLIPKREEHDSLGRHASE